MNRIINYLLLTIIFVFDPLAIALVIASNFAFGQISYTNYIPKPIKIRQSKPTQIIKREEKEKDNIEVDNLNTLSDDEKRMDIIGQNGNDGLHYDELDLNKDGVIDKNEKLLAINSLKNEITQTKLKGDDNRVDILKRRLQGLLNIFKK
jgi:hypothetical protein